MELLLVLFIGIALASFLEAIDQRRKRKRERFQELERRLHQYKG